MVADKETIRRIGESRKSWAKALAATGSGLFETYRDTGDAYAVFTGEDSPYDFAFGSFYPASLETLAGLYKGRVESFFAIPTEHPSPFNTLIGAGGKVASVESLLVRTLEPGPHGDRTPLVPETDLLPWAEIVRQGPYGGWSDDQAPEDFRAMAQAEGVRRYVDRKDGEAVAAATVFVEGGTAILLDLTASIGHFDRDMIDDFLGKILAETASDADLIWSVLEVAHQVETLNRSGFSIAQTQVVFEIPLDSF